MVWAKAHSPAAGLLTVIGRPMADGESMRNEVERPTSGAKQFKTAVSERSGPMDWRGGFERSSEYVSMIRSVPTHLHRVLLRPERGRAFG